MDKILWKTLGAFDLVHSSYRWIPARFFCGKLSSIVQTWLFEDSDSAGDLEVSESISCTLLCIFGSQKFVPISWMFKKQTSVSHSSTEAELISLDAGLRVDDNSRSNSLTFDDWSISFRTEQHRRTQERATRKPVDSCQVKHAQTHPNNMHKLIQIKHISVIPTNVDNIPSNTKFLLQCHVVCLWEKWEGNRNDDQRSKCHNETWFAIPQSCTGFVIWRINLDSRIRIRCIDTKHQLTDMLTEGNVTRDEWINLLHVININHFRPSCST